MPFMRHAATATVLIAGAATAQPAATARTTLVRAAFSTDSKAQALTLVNTALASLDATLARTPGDRDAQLQRGIGIGYRGQLTRSIGDAKAARAILAQLVQRDPRDADAQLALGGWHLSVLAQVGNFVGGTVLGASRKDGVAALDRAVALGGNRAFFPAYAGLMRLSLDAGDRQAQALLERAARAAAPNDVDTITKAAAQQVLQRLRAGDAKGASALAERSLPFGRVG